MPRTSTFGGVVLRSCSGAHHGQVALELRHLEGALDERVTVGLGQGLADLQYVDRLGHNADGVSHFAFHAKL